MAAAAALAAAVGVDPSLEQWRGILAAAQARKLLPFFDSAYQVGRWWAGGWVGGRLGGVATHLTMPMRCSDPPVPASVCIPWCTLAGLCQRGP